MGNLQQKSDSSVSALGIFDQVPPELVIEVLVHLSGKELIHVCRLVCKDWRDLIDGQALWKEKCIREGVFRKEMTHYAPDNFRIFYFKRPYSRNLIKNANAKEALHLHWKATSIGGNGFKVENMNKAPGCYPLDSPNPDTEGMFVFLGMKHWKATNIGGNGFEVESQAHMCDPFENHFDGYCWATSFGWCSKYQIIDLVAEGVSEMVMDELKPKIYISEWTTARKDCASTYKLDVKLLKDNINENNPNQESILDSFDFERTVEQWQGGNWFKVEHTFQNYPPGVRYISFFHEGKDEQFWAGHYGPKMAVPTVKFVFNQE